VEWTTGKNINVVSPWYSNSRTAENSPHYIQLKPNLREHFDKMIFHAATNYPASELVLVGRDNRADRQWVSYLQSSFKRMFPNSMESPAELLLMENKLSSGEPVFKNSIQNRGRVFLFPHYTVADENFMFQALKRLSSEKGDIQIVVYGMPLIIESEAIGFDLYNALNLRVITPEFLDVENSAVKRFSQDFYQKFHTIPEKDAYEAFDKTLFAIKNLTLDQKEWNLNITFQNYLLTSFDIEPVVLNKNKGTIDFYENKHLFVLEFINGNFTQLNR
jgi:ABC-type branched-subunit amino acid transport system substrate-binding protein